MKLDTKNKTVEIQDETLGDIVAELQKLYPETWREFKIQPQIIQTKEWYPYYPTYPQYPLYQSEPWYNQKWIVTDCTVGISSYANDTVTN